jgi:hypothetical protein
MFLYCTGTCVPVPHVKGMSCEIELKNCDKFTELGINKGRGWFLNFPEAPLIFK